MESSKRKSKIPADKVNVFNMIKLLICKEKKQALISPKSPVGEKTSIPQKKDGIRDIWKKEIDLEYEYYLAALRAHRDSRYLIEERDGLISKFESAQIRNVELRKDIRALERELYTMCHKNAHNSCVIDGLQEIDEQVKQTRHFEADLKHKLSLAEKERSNCEEIMSLLQHEIKLLSNKNGVDAKLVDSLKPHTERLKDMLDSKKLENHQNAQEFKRELQTILEKGKEKDAEFDALMQESAVKSSWLEEIFLSVGDGRTQKIFPSENKEEESEKEELANPKAEKEAGKSDENVKENLKEKKRETAKLTSHADSMKNENAVFTKLISDYLQKLGDRFEDLLDQSVMLYMIDIEISFVRDYIERLNNIRLRRETKVEEEEVVRTEELEELETTLNIQRNEEAFLKMLLDHFLKRMKEGFLINSVFLHKSQEQAFEYLQL